MRWAKSVRYQSSISYQDEVYNIICDRDEYDDIALSINGEYVCDLNELPTQEELEGYVDDYVTIETMARQSFHKRSVL